MWRGEDFIDSRRIVAGRGGNDSSGRLLPGATVIETTATTTPTCLEVKRMAGPPQFSSLRPLSTRLRKGGTSKMQLSISAVIEVSRATVHRVAHQSSALFANIPPQLGHQDSHQRPHVVVVSSSPIIAEHPPHSFYPSVRFRREPRLCGRRERCGHAPAHSPVRISTPTTALTRTAPSVRHGNVNCDAIQHRPGYLAHVVSI